MWSVISHDHADARKGSHMSTEKRFPTILAMIPAVVLGGMAYAWAQSAFPVRLDREVENRPVEATIPANVGTISALAIRMKPQTAPPFACDATTDGFMYVTKDVGDTSPFHDTFFCFCRELDGVGFVWTQAPTATGACPGA